MSSQRRVSGTAVQRIIAVLGSAVFFVVAPCTLAGLVPWSMGRVSLADALQRKVGMAAQEGNMYFPLQVDRTRVETPASNQRG
jgi:hypothetical protein